MKKTIVYIAQVLLLFIMCFIISLPAYILAIVTYLVLAADPSSASALANSSS